MTDAHRIHLLREGDDDRATLVALQQAGWLHASLDIKRRDTSKYGGKEGMLKECAEAQLSIGLSAILIRDRDDLDADGVSKWFGEQLGRLLKTTPRVEPLPGRSVLVATIGAGPEAARAVLVHVGLSGADEVCKAHQVEEFAMDDYLLKLTLDSGVYQGISELKDLPFDKARNKLDETVRLLRRNAIPVRKSKRLLQLIYGLSGFRASPAKFAERLVTQAAKTLDAPTLANLMNPLLDDIEAARRVLQPSA